MLHESDAILVHILSTPCNAMCMFSCNLPPALLAEWPGSFMSYCCNTGWTHTEIRVSTGSWPWMRKFPARIWSFNLLITSPVLYHWAIPTPGDKATALCWQTGWCLAMSVLSPFQYFTNSNTHPTGQWKKQFPLVGERNSSTHHWTKPRTQLGSTNNYSKFHSLVENNTDSIGQ